MGSIVSRTLSVGQEHELLQKLESAGLNEDDAQKVIDSRKNELAKAIIALIRGGEATVGETYKATLNYGQSLEQMVAAGRYDWKNDDITSKHFPIEGEGKVEVEIILIHPNRVVSTDEAKQEIERDPRGLSPAKIEELLAFGAQHPELQRKYWIAALGSVWQRSAGDRYVAFLSGHAGERSLHLDWVEGDWSGRWRFAAVRK